MIDLRSDTITQPTPEMREAMATAPVGDDVFGEDPTVNALEEQVAELLGKEAAVYMPTGTMTNQVSVRTHTQPGDEVFMAGNAHIYHYEGGAPSALSGVICKLLPEKRGIFTADDLELAISPDNPHFPAPRLVSVENTSNRGSGSIWPLQSIQEVEKMARKHGLKMHMDGARLWNASVATGISEKEYASYFDSISVCFSKGLGAPVGSALAGSAEFIHRARRFRKQFGGSMRQAGIIAAGALHALNHHRARLAEDNANAKMLAEGLSNLPGVELDPNLVETNIVIFNITSVSAPELEKRLREHEVLVLAVSATSIRGVTNLSISSEEIPQVIDAVRKCL